MSEQQAYDRLISEILKQPKDRIKYPHMPVEEKVMECYKVLKLSTKDREILLNSGLTPETLDTFEEKIGAYSIAHANYIVSINSKDSLKEVFSKLETEAHNLRRRLLHDIKFAMENNSAAQKAIHKIMEGRSRNDLIYDFVPIKKLIDAYPDDLAKINFDYSLVEKAEILHAELQEILSQIKVSPKEISEVKDIRDKAYTYLDDALVKIKKHGQYVFWEDEERLSLYKSEFMVNIGHKKGKSKIEILDPIKDTISQDSI